MFTILLACIWSETNSKHIANRFRSSMCCLTSKSACQLMSWSSNIIDQCPEILRPEVHDEMRVQGLVDEDEALGYIFCTRAFQTSQALCILNSDHNSQTSGDYLNDALRSSETDPYAGPLFTNARHPDGTNIRILRFTMSQKAYSLASCVTAHWLQDSTHNLQRGACDTGRLGVLPPKLTKSGEYMVGRIVCPWKFFKKIIDWTQGCAVPWVVAQFHGCWTKVMKSMKKIDSKKLLWSNKPNPVLAPFLEEQTRTSSWCRSKARRRSCCVAMLLVANEFACNQAEKSGLSPVSELLSWQTQRKCTAKHMAYICIVYRSIRANDLMLCLGL